MSTPKISSIAFASPEEIARRAREEEGPKGDEARAFLATKPVFVGNETPEDRDLARVVSAVESRIPKIPRASIPFFHADGSPVLEGELVAFELSRGATMHRPKPKPTPTESTLAALQTQVRLVAKLSKRLGIERAKRKALAKTLATTRQDLATLLDTGNDKGVAGWLARAVLGIQGPRR